MILDSIILSNFGAYHGHQRIDLTPEEGKPIILFGGMNGGGKTTLLDAVQLAFYGSKARLSNRGRLGYKEYLKESIHRGSNPEEGASITINFRRLICGEIHCFELQRSWKKRKKDVEETIRVYRNDIYDNISTEHWDQIIEAYLPSGIAHLFFFDGEQIKDLAEGRHASDILGTAVHSLLGLDLVDRLETDLKIFERRKKTEELNSEAAQKYEIARSEYEQVDRELEKVAMQEGALVNENGRIAKDLLAKKEIFRAEGGELYLRSKEIELDLDTLKKQKEELESRLRELWAGPLPLLFVDDLLGEVEEVIRHETKIRNARVMRDALVIRDREVIDALKGASLGQKSINKISKILEDDYRKRIGLAEEPLIIDAEESLVPHLAHLRAVVLPGAKKKVNEITEQLHKIDEKTAYLEGERVRIPPEERIAVLQKEIEKIRFEHDKKLAELNALRVRKQALQRQRLATEVQMDKITEQDIEARNAEDARQRMLKHAEKVRGTLKQFRKRIVQRHIDRIKKLMLESFRQLLHKKDLIMDLDINPESFEITLTGRDGKKLPFDRLSAGEKQLLATSLLWGLARASGRPVPTIIDTPLGRLDSSHRRHLVERYFPMASHQVLLLSTDEEIVGSHYEQLKSYITRSYILEHNGEIGQTRISQGYFL